VGEGDPKTRFSKAYQELIRSAFPKLKMVHGAFSETTVAAVVRDQDDLLDGLAVQLSEAEQEVLVEVERSKNQAERLSAEALVRKFKGRPYGGATGPPSPLLRGSTGSGSWSCGKRNCSAAWR
jgi:hypothetical protein